MIKIKIKAEVEATIGIDPKKLYRTFLTLYFWGPKIAWLLDDLQEISGFIG